MSANRLLASLWLLVSAGLLVMPLLGVDPTTRLYYSNAGQVLVTLTSSFYCFATMRAFPAQSPLGKVWGAIGAGLLAWAIAAGIFAAYPILNAGEDTPYPSLADPFYLLAPPLMTIGLLLFKRSAGSNRRCGARRSPSPRWRSSATSPGWRTPRDCRTRDSS